jgi:hypothetical protein
MRNFPQPTVDIAAERISTDPDVATISSATGYRPNFGAAIQQTLATDGLLTAVSMLMGFLSSQAISSLIIPDTVNRASFLPSPWLVFAACLLPAIASLLADGINSLKNPAYLPFSRSKSRLRAIYAKRIHLILLAFYFTAILVALCWSAITMPIISKIFVSAVLALALYALGQSIPSRRLSFIVSGILFLVVLVVTQAFMVLKLEADAGLANQKALEGIAAPPIDEGKGLPSGDEAAY